MGEAFKGLLIGFSVIYVLYTVAWLGQLLLCNKLKWRRGRDE